MKTNRATDMTLRRAAGLPRLGNERGMLLVVTMIILLVISTLAAANLINAFLERSIAKNQNHATVALNAADAGIDSGVAWLADPANRLLAGAAKIPTTGVAWTWAPTGVDANGYRVRTLANGGRYELKVSTKADDEDRDKDNSTSDIVLYNNVVPAAPQGDAANDGKFGYLDAKEAVAGKGYPVMTIRSKGYGAAGYRELVVDVARVKDLPPGAKGAVTSKDPVDFGNSFAQAKDGRGHALNGLLCSDAAAAPPCECGDDSAGLFVETGAVHCTNPPQNDVPAGCSDPGKDETTLPVVPGGLTVNPPGDPPLCATAECVLGYKDSAGNPSRALLEAAAKENGRIFGPGAGETPINNATISAALETLPAGAIVIVKGNFQMLAGTNVDAAHAKRLVVDGTFDALGNTLFTGLLVAKDFSACGNLVVNGAAVCVGDGNSATRPFANGNVHLQYSCDALAAAVGQVGYTVRLGWKRENY